MTKPSLTGNLLFPADQRREGNKNRIIDIKSMMQDDGHRYTVNRIDCHKCLHYFVTWEPVRPHGCKRMGFKSPQLPSVVVHLNSGAPCRAFDSNKSMKKPSRGNHDN